MPDPVDIVQIEGDLVRYLRTELVKEARLQDVIPGLEYRPPVTLGLLPKTAVFVHWDESDPKMKRAQILAELAPGVRTCNYIKKVTVSIPWTYFLFDFETKGDPMSGALWTHTNTRVFWSQKQVTSLDDEIGTALVPNVDAYGIICWGSTGVDASLPLGIRVDRTVDEFYRTQFTHSNGAGSPWQSETGDDNWERWAEETKKDPAAFMKFPEWGGKKDARRDRVLIKMQSVRSIMGTLADRSAPIEVEGRIPERVTPMTFGRTREWLNDMDPEDRYTLWYELDAMKGEDPGSVRPRGEKGA